jgi:hypothetical protein
MQKESRMAAWIKDDVLAICRDVAATRSDVAWHKARGCFAMPRTKAATLEITPGWQFSSRAPTASADWRLVLRNTLLEKTAKAIFGYPMDVRSGPFHTIDRGMKPLHGLVCERGGSFDRLPSRPDTLRLIYLDELPGWLNGCIDTGLAVARAHLGLGSDRAVLMSAKARDNTLAERPLMVLIAMMLGDHDAAHDFMRNEAYGSGSFDDNQAIDAIRLLEARANEVPVIP